MRQFIHQISVLYHKHYQLLAYLFFGVLTTLVNTVAYGLSYYTLGVSNAASTVLAWAAAVLFAYVTNKLLVFQSRQKGVAGWLRELVLFVGCRLLTGVLDVGIMVVAVDWLRRNGMFWKLISNVIVVVANFFASKLLIFKKQ